MEKQPVTGNRKRVKSAVYFLLALAIAIILTSIIKEPTFNESQTYVLFLLLFSVGLWLTEAVPPFSVGLLIIAFLAYSLGYEQFTSAPVDVSMYVQTLSSPVIWLMLGGFFLAAAMTKTRLDHDLITVTMKICGTNPKWILFGMMSVTMFASMLISNTATTSMVVAAVMPLLLKLGKRSPISKALILGIPIAATTGGMGTLIGSPPNAIAAGALFDAGTPIDFIAWIYYGLPITLALTFISWWILVKLFIKNPVVISSVKTGEKEEPADHHNKIQRWVVIVVLVITILLWLTSPIHQLRAAAVAAVPLVLFPITRIITGEDIRGMGWDTLLLVAGGLSLGSALQHTGLLDLYAGRIASLDVPQVLFFFLLAYATMIFSNIMSNTATSTVLIPLGMAIFPESQIEVAMIIGLSASTALFLPVSTPPNAIAYSTGLIEQKDFRIGGALIGLIGPALIVLWVLLIS